jgi:putative tryptophan/tyrosine transport system ATP-binding protein
MADPALEVRELAHTFHRGTLYQTAALGGVSLTLDPGAFVVILGSNGSGKSTLLNAIAGSLAAESGTVKVGGTDVTGWREHRRARLIARVFQDPFAGTASDMTVLENLAIASARGQRRGFHRALVPARREELAASVATLGLGLEERLGVPMGLLSGGQRQALTLLMAMLVRPTLLLLDEHTAALDPKSAEQLIRLTQSFVAVGQLTTIMVTHSMPQAVRLGDRILIMHRGRVAFDLTGVQRRRARVEDLLSRFEELRRRDMLDDEAAEKLMREYV